MSSNVLVIAAHPDDEVLGCGGTLAKHHARGDDVHVAFVADGVSSREQDAGQERLLSRRDAARRACDILGVTSVSFGDFPDNRMDSIDLLDVVKTVEQLIAVHAPSRIYTHHAGDLNIDHQRLHQAVVTACRPQRGHPVNSLLFFEIASSTEWQVAGSAPVFAPNWFEDIGPHLQTKLDAMAVYSMELRDRPHPRSLDGIEALARWRGASVGSEAAEAFVLGRKLG